MHSIKVLRMYQYNVGSLVWKTTLLDYFYIFTFLSFRWLFIMPKLRDELLDLMANYREKWVSFVRYHNPTDYGYSCYGCYEPVSDIWSYLPFIWFTNLKQIYVQRKAYIDRGV